MRRITIVAALAFSLASSRAFAADEATAGTAKKAARTRTPNEGLTIAAQGGLSGFSGGLGPRLGRGGSWGVLLGAQATPILGLELDYIGASNSLQGAGGGRLMRNSANADLKIALIPSAIEPYVFGGIGVSRFMVSGVTPSPTPGASFSNATAPQVPVGAGLNLYLGALNIGARVTYDFLLSRRYAPENDRSGLTGNTWTGQAQLGVKF